MRSPSPNSVLATASAVGVASEKHEMSLWLFAAALACGIWYFFIILVQAIGFTQLFVKGAVWREVMLMLKQIPLLLLEAKTCCFSQVKPR
jgi:hypothetical protein